MNLKDLLKTYESMEAKKPPDNPMEILIGLKERVHEVIHETVHLYLEDNPFSARRMAAEVRDIREVLLEFQLVLEGISLADGEKDGTPQEVDLRES